MADELRLYLADLFSQFSGQDAVLIIPRPYLTLCDNDHRAALLLSQCVYWSDRTSDSENWFAKSYVEWEAELGLSEYEVRRATKALAKHGLETKLKKFSGAPTVHYRIDKAKLSESILKKLQKPSLRNSRIDPVETQESLTEITTESTANTKDKTAPSGALNSAISETTPATAESAPIEAVPDPYADWIPGDQVPDEPPLERYPCSAADIAALIAAWWDWVPKRPTLRGAVIPAKQHYANTTIRAFARSLIERGVMPADMARFLGEIRVEDDSPYAYLRERELPFNYVGEALQDWIVGERERNWYIAEEPRFTPRKPSSRINLNLTWSSDHPLEEYAHHPEMFVDLPRPYIPVHALEANTDADVSEPFSASDAELLAEGEIAP